MSRSAILKRLIPSLVLPALLSVGLSGCFTLRQGVFAPPTAAEIGPVLDNYGEAVVPAHGLIVVQGDDLIYGVADSRRPGINGSAVHRTGTTITETMRQALRPVAIVNQGYPGDTAAMGAQRWDDAPVGNLVILSYGYGDAVAGTPVADYSLALRGMVRRAHVQGAAVFLIPTPPVAAPPLMAGRKPKPGPHPLLSSDIEPYRAAMRQIGLDEAAEVFEPQTEITRVRAPIAKAIAQAPETYQAIASGLVPYIRIVQPPKRR